MKVNKHNSNKPMEGKDHLLSAPNLVEFFEDLEAYDYSIMFGGLLGALATGIAMPAFNLHFGRILGKMNGSERVFDREFCLDVVALMGLAAVNVILGFLQVYCWSVVGKRQSQKCKLRSQHLDESRNSSENKLPAEENEKQQNNKIDKKKGEREEDHHHNYEHCKTVKASVSHTSASASSSSVASATTQTQEEKEEQGEKEKERQSKSQTHNTATANDKPCGKSVGKKWHSLRKAVGRKWDFVCKSVLDNTLHNSLFTGTSPALVVIPIASVYRTSTSSHPSTQNQNNGTHENNEGEESDSTKSTHSTDKIKGGYDHKYYKGNCVENFAFLDQDERNRDQFIDIQYTHQFKVRDEFYLHDKQKTDAGPSIAKLVMMEKFHVDTKRYGDRHDHIASMGRVKKRIDILHNLPGNPFVLVLNLQIPGDPPVSLCFYFLIPLSFYPGVDGKGEMIERDEFSPARKLFKQFISLPLTPPVVEREEWMQYTQERGGERGVGGGKEKCKLRTKHSSSNHTPSSSPPSHSSHPTHSTANVNNYHEINGVKSVFYAPPAVKKWNADVVWPNTDAEPNQPGILPKDSFQNTRFKFIPSMVEGPWVVKMAVSSTPVLMGQKVIQRCWRGEGYMEIDVNIGSSAIADNIVGLCRNYSKAFICNMGIVLQGETDEELPEKMLACAAVKYIDIDIHSDLEDFAFLE